MSETVKDPICGKEVDPLRARAVGIFGGVTYYFCSQDCKARFKDPRKQAREPTKDIATRDKKKEKEVESATAAAGPVEVVKPIVKNRDELKPLARDDESTKPKTEPSPSPSPSIEEELNAVQKSRGAWLIVVTLLLVAALVLFLYLRK